MRALRFALCTVCSNTIAHSVLDMLCRSPLSRATPPCHHPHGWAPSSRKRRLALTTRAAAGDKYVDRTAALRQLLSKPGILLGPCAHDGLSARLIEQAGFDFAFMSGFCTAASRLGAPDTGLMSYAEMVDSGRNMHEATRALPIIGDGDTGYGNAVNVKRTVKGYAAAGFAGILIEDQVWPKSCGHVRNKRVVPREEAVQRIRAACDARDEGRDILIVARTDARQAESLEEALWRVAAFADQGADVVFVDALASVEEMQRLCAIAPSAAKMANMLEGGGKTPLLPPRQLEEIGFKLCAYPLSLLGVSVRAMEVALQGLKRGEVPTEPAMPSFQELQAAVGFPEYYREEERYAVVLPTTTTLAAPPAADSAAAAEAAAAVAAAAGAAAAAAAAAAAVAAPASAANPEVEADEVVEPGGQAGTAGNAGASTDRTIDLVALGSEEGQYGPGDAGRQPQWLRVRVSDVRTGSVNLDLRFPAGFLSTVTSFVPQVAGVDLEGLLKQAKGEGWDPTKPVVDFDSAGDRIEIFLEFK